MMREEYQVQAVHESDGTPFTAVLPPPMAALDGYDIALPCSQQKINVPHIFRDAMHVREVVFGKQGIPFKAEFDDDDARSWHWVIYASVGTPSPPHTRAGSSRDTRASRSKDAVEQAVARCPSASRVPVGAIRLIPPPHAANKYRRDSKMADDMRTDKDTPTGIDSSKLPNEPFVKLDRLAVLPEYQKMGLGKLLVNAALDYASQHPDDIYLPSTSTIVELASLHGRNEELQYLNWQGLVMINAQTNLMRLWTKLDFHEALKNPKGEVEIEAEPRWKEEGVEHVVMWKRLQIVNARL